MPRRKCVTKFWCGVLFAVLLVGCSSTHTARRGSSSTTVASATHAASTEPKDAAIALASRMLDKAVLPAGARPSTAPPPAVVRGPSVPGIGNLVFAHRLFTVNEAPHAVWQWLQAHVPKGFVGVGGSSGTDRGVPSWGVEDDLSAVPTNISAAELQFGIAGDASGRAVVRVDTVVGWTEPRPTDEFVSARDRVVIVNVVRGRGPAGKRVVTADPRLVQPIIQEFNRLRVEPPDSVCHCPPSGARTVAYKVAFATTPSTTPDVVATIGLCGPIRVTVGGTAAPSLAAINDQPFGDAVAHVLGLSEPHFG